MGTESAASAPLSVFAFQLSKADALAYEMLPGELSLRMKLLLLMIVASGGLLVGFLPEALSPAAWWSAAATIMAIAAVSAVAVTNVAVHRRAAGLFARQGEVAVEDWGDHLSIVTGTGKTFLAIEMIGKVITMPAHVFVLHHDGPTIFPLRAFADEGEMRAFGESLERRSREAVQ